ncbi:MAG TPA: (Fe-S)-binding protein [Bacteroidales bacterium]|nr:(Fe-S)-binding protein [Bacteroidales bacterium]
MRSFDPFVLPFSAGALFLLVALTVIYTRWLRRLSPQDRWRIWRRFFSRASLEATSEVFSECLLHRRIFKKDIRLGYMHMSLAFGWFLLIVAGFIQTRIFPLEGPDRPWLAIFFRFFYPETLKATFGFDLGYEHLMDALLLFILSGVALALLKRWKSRWLGMKHATRHSRGDRVALSVLWLIFPLRLLAESLTSGVFHSGGFLTGTLGSFLASFLPVTWLAYPAWWAYSLALGAFFVALPYSRYMHIFTEVLLIFLRKWGVRTHSELGSPSEFEVFACSRCGICLDACPMQEAAGITGVQAVYLMREIRENKLSLRTSEHCLLCGSCAEACPVDIDVNRLRLAVRKAWGRDLLPGLSGLPATQQEAQTDIIYYAGCMTHLTPGIIRAMTTLFEAAGDKVWFYDKDGDACCGRPILLSGQNEAAAKLIDFNRQRFISSKAHTLVTSCPICYKIFREQYVLPMRVLHHSQYIHELLHAQRLTVEKSTLSFTYHDPCELGRGSGIYHAPRAVLRRVGSLLPTDKERADSLCCGGSLANTVIQSDERRKIADYTLEHLLKPQPDILVTSCPLCKKTFGGRNGVLVKDLAEVVSVALTDKKEDQENIKKKRIPAFLEEDITV